MSGTPRPNIPQQVANQGNQMTALRQQLAQPPNMQQQQQQQQQMQQQMQQQGNQRPSGNHREIWKGELSWKNPKSDSNQEQSLHR